MNPEDRQHLRDARKNARARLLTRLEDEGCDVHADRLRKCGDTVRLKCTVCACVHAVEKRCDLKWCPACAPLLARRTGERFSAVVGSFHAPLYITWTTKNFDARSKTETGMRAVRRAHSKLKDQRWFRRHINGGVVGFEMTRKKRGWHPHAHGIYDCPWLGVTIQRPPPGTSGTEWKIIATKALRECAAKWSKALGGRPGSCKVRRITKRPGQTVGDALRETLKYSVTAESLDNMTGKLELFLDELSLTRNVTSFGSAHNHPLLKKRKGEAQPCEGCGEFGTFLPEALVNRFAELRGNTREGKRNARDKRASAIVRNRRAA